MNLKRYRLSFCVFIITFSLLAVVQLKVENPVILAERFMKGGGWIEILLISCYGAFIGFKMQDRVNVPYWRKLTWTIFALVFFGQLITGLSGIEKFLMTGKLHLPVPVMIIAGPLYRGQLSVMTILFFSTIILTGPAWCSHLCYFGAFDNLASSGNTSKNVLRNKVAIKSTLLLLVVSVALIFRWLNASLQTATIFGIGFGITGVSVMIIISSRRKKMIHCILYCPVGTVVNLIKPINPFRLYIDQSCTFCLNCSKYCKYDALNIQDIKVRKPSFSCTLCGDCLAGCHHNSIKYRFFRMDSENARTLYLILTLSLHASFLALARI